MSVAIFTSAGVGTPWAELTVANRLAYCVRHDYTMVWRCEAYSQALSNFWRIGQLLEHHDLVWTLDADCVITNLTTRIEDVPDLGPHMTICEEGIGAHALVNGGSIVWRATQGTHSLLDEIVAAENEWRSMEWNVQQWLMKHRERLADRMTIAPKRAFNSVHLGQTNHWQHGDLVYHPCGNPPDIRCELIREHLGRVVT
jgi:hypothetical protein